MWGPISTLIQNQNTKIRNQKVRVLDQINNLVFSQIVIGIDNIFSNFIFYFLYSTCILSDGTPSSARHPTAFPKQTEEISHDQQIAGCLLLLTEKQTAQTVCVAALLL